MEYQGLITEYHGHLAGEGKSVRTADEYIRDLRDFIRWFEQNIRKPFEPESVRTEDLLGYCRYLLDEQKLSVSTVNRRISSLRAFFLFLTRRGYLPNSPASDLRFFRSRDASAQ